MIKLLIGGSPCTYWSIAQKNNRETEASGLGWELFKNYLTAKEKFKPDYFLYENNWSAAPAIKQQISTELGVDLMRINSALVSAQSRDRFYCFNWDVEQPKDRGIYLKDILQSGEDLSVREKAYCLTASYVGATPQNTIEHNQKTMIAEPVQLSLFEPEPPEPVIIQRPRGFNRGGVKKDKSPTLTAHNWQNNNVVAEPVAVACRNRREADGKLYRRPETSNSTKSNALTTVQTDSMVAEPVRIGTIESNAKNKESKQYRVYSADGKSTTLCGEGGGIGAKTGLYAVPANTGAQLYTVEGGLIEIKGKKYPIKLADGSYIIRKLTPIECERLQTLPDGYTAAVSNAQRYKGLGNGWTAEVIIHILRGVLDAIPRDEEIVVLSMYDGIGTGRYCLDKMGFTNVKYYAYEIDKFAIKVATSNFPDIVECGNAFDLNREEWEIGKPLESVVKTK